MTVGDLANEYGISKHTACLIARDEIHAFRRVHKGEAYGLTRTEIAMLRPLFLAARPTPRPALAAPMLTGFEEDKPMMIVKEVAEALRVSDRTIQRHAAALGLTEDGKATLLDEEAVTKIKIAIERSGRNDLDNVVEVGKVTTELEIAAMTAQVLNYWHDRANTLEVEVASKREALALAAPKVESFDRFIDAKGTLCLQDAGKQLGHHPNKFIDTLAERGFLFRRNGTWIARQEYIDRGWFIVRTGGEGIIYEQTRVTPKGLDGLAKVFPVGVSA